uniref:ORF2 n=1 Tax=Bombyx mori TaxID=7091 RepID=Q93139_BOMMO|nr:ORF2 [Bombyx mori]
MKGFRGVRVFQSTAQGDGTVKAAIAVFDHDLDVIQYPQLTTNNIVVVGIRTRAWEITLVSYYFEPDKPIESYLEQIKRVERKMGPKRLIFGGDANAKSTWWGCKEDDARGDQLMGTLGELGLHILNEGDVPTFDTIRGGKRYQSRVDVTFCTEDMLDLIDGWRVDEDLVSSDHNGMVFNIRLQKSKSIKIERTTRIFNTKKANWSLFHEKMAQLLLDNNMTTLIDTIDNKTKVESAINTYTNIITKTCEQSIPKKTSREILTIPWWSEKLAEMRKETNTMRRRIRNAAQDRRQHVVDEYLKQKEKYESEVREAQAGSWKEFCGKQDREGVWEGIYRVMSRARTREEDCPLTDVNGAPLDPEKSAKLLAETFYPEDREEEDNDEHAEIRRRAKISEGVHDEYVPSFTVNELKHALKSFNPKKAPGADGLTSDICTHAVDLDQKLFLGLINKCLEHRYFPKIWKAATVVILRKSGKDSYTEPKSHRPIGLLPVLGKLYEKMLVARLKYHLLPRMSTRQFGFMPQRSTEDSLYTLMQHVKEKLKEKRIITIVSLDIEGAFDSAWWPALEVRLAEEKCPEYLRRVISSYLSDRRVSVRYAGAEYERATSKGCVQGSIGGPILWNLLLDPLIHQLQARGEYIQAFADDVVLVFDGDSALQIERQANTSLEHVQAWGVRNKLKFAPHKTCAMTITRRLKYDTPRLNMGGTEIATYKELRILGLTIDDKLTFNTHVRNVCKKAIGMYKILARTARVGWGLSPEVIRVIYVAVVEPTVLYAAAVWHESVYKLGVQKQLNVIQRGFAQKLCRAYRTVSLNSALLMAGILPLDLRVREAASLFEAKKGVCQSWLGDREIERMSSAMDAPHPAEQQSLEFGNLVDEEQYNNLNHLDVRIFTDGSKIEGRVGAALSIWDGEVEIRSLKLALAPYCTVYQAELLALSYAVKEAQLRNGSTFGVFSDSKAALLTVINHGSLHPLAVDIRKMLKQCALQNKTVALYWIKAHAGLEGNERADQLAKEAALLSKKSPNYDLCPVSYVKRIIRSGSLDEWNRRYRDSDRASVTKMFFPDAVAAYSTVRKMRITGHITQFTTGHGGFSEYLARFKCKGDPSCACEPGMPETVEHLLTSCPIFGKQRFELENKINKIVNKENLCKLIVEKYTKELFIVMLYK